MLIHNLADSGEIDLLREESSICRILEDNENELRFTALAGAQNGANLPKGT